MSVGGARSVVAVYFSWRATLRRGRLPSASGRDRSASLRYRKSIAAAGYLQSVSAELFDKSFLSEASR